MSARSLFISTLAAFLPSLAVAQETIFPFAEKFDTVAAPKLPAGWNTSIAKNAAGDFATAASTPYSAPNAVLSTDARVPQFLLSPPLSFAERIAGTLEFRERRTSTHNAGLLVEALTAGDTASVIMLSDTLKNPGTTNYVLRSLRLPASLNGQSGVRFRWRIAGNGTGATGTLRIDDILVTIEKNIDLAVTSMRLHPEKAAAGEELAVHVGIANRGSAGVRSFVVRLMDEWNLDSSASCSNEAGREVISGLFGTGDSSECVLRIRMMKPGTHTLTADVAVPGDEDSTNDSASLSCTVAWASRALLINEIMYAPAAGPEWVECINASGETISPAQWKVGDNSGARTAILAAGVRIPPGTFFLLAKDTSVFSHFPFLHAPVIKVSFPSLNNDEDAVVLLDPTGRTIDSVAYRSEWGGTGGKSLERIDTAGESNNARNWATSHAPLGATPGLINSVSRKEFDLSVEALETVPGLPTANHAFDALVTVRNAGLQTITRCVVELFLDANRDSLPQPSELIAREIAGAISPGQAARFDLPSLSLSQGEQELLAVVSTERDDDATNNSRVLPLTIGAEPKSIIINEIMYAPPGDMPEWIEFRNVSSSPMTIAGWKISDANTRSKAAISASSPFIGPGGYFVAATDSSMLGYYPLRVPLVLSHFSPLNNTTPDAVVLFDTRGVAVDSVFYRPSWGGADGSSLERVDDAAFSCDSANWRSSVPTPGAENSVAKRNHDIALSSGAARSGENGITLAATVTNTGREFAGGVNVFFFWDANGDGAGSEGEALHRAEGIGLKPGDSVTIEYVWRPALGGRLPVIVHAEYAEDERPSNNSLFIVALNHFTPGSVIINEILYEPAPQFSEFVEFYNQTHDTIDMQSWKMMDAPSAAGNRSVVQMPSSPQRIAPDGYYVVAADSSFFIQFPLAKAESSGNVFIANKDLSLNNGGDDIVLVDHTGARMDSLHFTPAWHNPSLNTPTAGKSLERVNPGFESNDSRNWSTSVDGSGGTPLRRNSIYTRSVPSAASIALSPNPFSPDNDGFEDFLVISYALPSVASMVRVRCFDVQGRLVRTLANNEPAASRGTIVWNGRDDEDRRVRIGMYIILFEALDVAGGVVRAMKEVAVVTTKL